MTAKTMSSEDRNLRKQIGCMNGLFQLFDRHHKQKRLLLGAQHQLQPHVTTKPVTEHKQEPRTFKESPESSKSSSSCSSTLSSLDHNTTNISESPFNITAENVHGPSLSTGPQSQQIRSVVKDSMYREARSVSIKSFTNNNNQKITTMKHVDSPRPLHKPKFEKPEKAKATSYEESRPVSARDERLILRRLSYDGRESRETPKTKHKELPRLSLDSRVSSVKYSGQDSRLNFTGQASGGHSRTSSIVAKLMGLENFPETIITTDEVKIVKIISSPSPSPSPKLTVSSGLPIEPDPWKQAEGRKFPEKTRHSSSSSVYAEMEKRVTELEFKRSGKDLRALKQILEAMQKTKDKLENQRPEPAKIQKQKNCCPENSRSPTRITKSAQITEKVRVPKSRKKITSRISGLEHTLRTPQRTTVENYATAQRDFEMVSLKSRPNDLYSSGRAQRCPSKKIGENRASSEKTEVNESTDFQFGDDQLSELSNVKSESDYSVASHLETEVMSLANLTNPNSREHQNLLSSSKEHMPAVELAEQPSPVSVLDSAFYAEDSPSPIKKINTAFQDENSRPDEAEWPLENRNHFSDCKYNQNSKDMSILVHETRLLKIEPSQITVDHNEPLRRSLVPDQKYINRIITASGLFDGACVTPTANQLVFSNFINPEIFHVLEETEEKNGEEFTEKKNRKDLNHTIQKRIVFDTVSEILARKISSDGLFTAGRRRTSSERLVKEIYLEMDRLRAMPYENLDDEGDESIRLLTADMKYQSDDWTHCTVELPTVVLEIERLIFKDLINEVVIGEVEGLHNLQKKHCRKLFTK